MIDNIKIVTYNTAQINKIWRNDLLLYHSNKDYRVNDEIRSLEKKTYKNLFFTKYHNRLEINGSIHKFWNDGLHNANDFNVIDSINTLTSLISTFNIKPHQFKIIGLEYGMNMVLEKCVNKFLKQLKFYGKRPIIESIEHKNFYVSGTKYKSIKIYNKTQDYPKYSKPNNLRFEVKINKAQLLQKINIVSLEDLLIIETYNTLNEMLLNEWNEIILFEPEIRKLKKYHSIEYWLNAIENMSRNTFYNRRKTYKKSLPKKSTYIEFHKRLKNKTLTLLNCAHLPNI